MKEELLKLAERVEALSGPDHRIDAEVARAFGWTYQKRDVNNVGQWHRRSRQRPACFDISTTLAG